MPRAGTLRSRYWGAGYAKGSAVAGRCFCAVSFMKASSSLSKRLVQHVRYLQRESASMKTSDEVRFFGNIEPDQFARGSYEAKRVFKLVVSPEEYFSMGSPDIFVSSFMREVQQRAGLGGKGQSVDWMGYLHTNTPSPHIHILVAGRARDGADFFLPRALIKSLRNVGASVQNALTGGFEISQEIRQERAWVTSPKRTPAIEGLSLDTLVERQHNEFGYEELLRRVPHSRRRALHGRLIYLERNSLMSIGGGQVRKTPTFDVDFARLGELTKEIQLSRALRYVDGRAVYYHDTVASSIGLVTGVLETRHHGTVGLVETIKGEVLAMRLVGDAIARVRGYVASEAPVTVKGGAIALAPEDVADRVTKLRARGPVVDQIQRLSTSTEYKPKEFER